MQLMNGGTRRSHLPEGDGSLQSELDGNKMADKVAHLCRLQAAVGNYYSIENPRSSYVWDYKGVTRLKFDGGLDVDFDQCMFGLTPPHLDPSSGQRIRKATRIRTNLASLLQLSSKCDHCHEHYHCLGSVRFNGERVSVARAAGCYPPQLCRSWAKYAAQGLDILPKDDVV